MRTPSLPAPSPSLPLPSTTRVLDSGESTRRRSGCFPLPAAGTWAGAMPGEKRTFTLAPWPAGTCRQGGGLWTGPGRLGWAPLPGAGAGLPTCQARCPPTAWPLCHALARAVPGRRAAASWLGGHALRWQGAAGGHAIGMGLTSARRGSLARAPAALKPPFVPGQPLALGIQVMPGGREAETKQPSPWQCPPAWDKCPRLGGEDGHKDLPAGTGGTARATPSPGPGRMPWPGTRHPRKRGCPSCGHRAPCTLLLPKTPPHRPGIAPCLMLCPALRWDWGCAALLPLPPAETGQLVSRVGC